MKNREEEDPSDGLLGLAHRAPDPGGVSVADVDVPLHRQCQSEPKIFVEFIRKIKHSIMSIQDL